MKCWVVVVLVLSLPGCKKENYNNSNDLNDIKLPSQTETGAGTFGFMMNDQVWTVFGAKLYSGWLESRWIPNRPSGQFGYNDDSSKREFWLYGELTIVRKDTIIRDYTATITFYPTMRYVKTYFLQPDSILWDQNFSLDEKDLYNGIFNQKDYSCSATNPFMLEITRLDTVQKICSGRFQGTIYQGGLLTWDSLVITQGSFDVKYQ
jgi:hypothetical protein